MLRGHSEWERVTLELLSEEQAQRRKLEENLASIQQALSEVDRRVTVIQAALDAYRPRHEAAQPVIAHVAGSVADEYRNLTHKGMVMQWASTHNGEVRTRDMTAALTAAGIFRDKEQAAGALFPAVARLAGLQKIGRGIYRMNPRLEIDSALAVKHNGQYEPTEQAGEGESDRMLGRGQLDSQHSSNDWNTQEHHPETPS